MKINIYELEKAWEDFNKHRQTSFLDYLIKKHSYHFNTIIEVSDEQAYKMIKSRLMTFNEEVKNRRKVVDMWNVLNDDHPYFVDNKSLQFRHPKYIIEPKMVNDEGKRDYDEFKNVHLNYWFEVLVPYNPDKEQQCNQIHWGGKENIPMVAYRHDMDLDGGGKTYEEAIEKLYHLVCGKYGYPK